jgi:hypothetical protein
VRGRVVPIGTMVRGRCLVLLLSCLGCSGSTATVASPPSYDVGGAWSGTFVSETGLRGTTSAGSFHLAR